MSWACPSRLGEAHIIGPKAYLPMELETNGPADCHLVRWRFTPLFGSTSLPPKVPARQARVRARGRTFIVVQVYPLTRLCAETTLGR